MSNHPTFEHRHYAKVASIIAELPDDIRETVADHFASKLWGTNPRYQRNRFFDAAMGEPSNGRDRTR